MERIQAGMSTSAAVGGLAVLLLLPIWAQPDRFVRAPVVLAGSIREKSERSTPMHQSRSSADTSSDISGASFSETDSVSNRSAMARLTPSSARASPKTPGSKPGSRPTSRPSSRAASDLSQDGIDIYKAGRKPTASTSSQNSVSAAKSSPAGSKIPSAKRISAKSSGRPGGLTTQRKEN